MKKFTNLLAATLLVFCGVNSAYAVDVPEGETNITTLEWANNGQDCGSNFDQDIKVVFGTDASGANLSYVDLSEYGTIKLYGTPNQKGRLFINRAECGDNGIFPVELDESGEYTFDCNTILTQQPKAQYIHLNGVIASAWNTTLNLSLITVSGDPITFPEMKYELADDETDLTSLEWINEGQGCVNNLASETDAPIYGTHDAAADGKLSYVDITNYQLVNLYGNPGDVVRLFINRAEYPDNFQFYVKIDENGLGKFDTDTVYATQEGAEYVHLNGIKAQSGKAYVELVGLVEKDFELSEGEIDLTTLDWVNEAQKCDNNIGKDTDETVYGTHDGANGEGHLSYVDITNFKELKLYGRAGDVVRCFINRAEYSGGTYQFYVTIDEDGVGTLNLADVYKEQAGAKYVHLNGIKTAATWQGSSTGKAKIKGITLAGIELNDNIDYVIKKDIATSVSYSRELAADKWSTICLPFDVPAAQLTGYTVLAFTGVSGNYAVFEEASGMTAHTPYLIKNGKDATLTIALSDATVKAVDTAETSGTGAKLVGIYEAQRVLSGNYALAGGEFHKASASNENLLKPYHAYLQATGGGAFRIALRNDASGIVDLEMGQAVEDGVFYNLKGQKVSNPTKGIYIFNGNKVMVK